MRARVQANGVETHAITTLPPIFATRPAGQTIEAMVSTVDARESSLAFSSGVMFFARCTPLMICCLALAAITPA